MFKLYLPSNNCLVECKIIQYLFPLALWNGQHTVLNTQWGWYIWTHCHFCSFVKYSVFHVVSGKWHFCFVFYFYFLMPSCFTMDCLIFFPHLCTWWTLRRFTFLFSCEIGCFFKNGLHVFSTNIRPLGLSMLGVNISLILDSQSVHCQFEPFSSLVHFPFVTSAILLVIFKIY